MCGVVLLFNEKIYATNKGGIDFLLQSLAAIGSQDFVSTNCYVEFRLI